MPSGQEEYVAKHASAITRPRIEGSVVSNPTSIIAITCPVPSRTSGSAARAGTKIEVIIANTRPSVSAFFFIVSSKRFNLYFFCSFKDVTWQD